MAFTISVPDNYGYVLLTTVIGQFWANMYMGGNVMAARKLYNVPYPNCYAQPGKDGDAFNRLQRGHQNMFETLTLFTAMALVGGLKHPIATAVYNACFYLGCVLYQLGYGDTKLDVAVARYKKGGVIKWIGFFGSFYSTVALAGNMLGWWK